MAHFSPSSTQSTICSSEPRLVQLGVPSREEVVTQGESESETMCNAEINMEECTHGYEVETNQMSP